jgi:hypothetical protein
MYTCTKMHLLKSFIAILIALVFFGSSYANAYMHQDTTKTKLKSVQALFGRAFLKSHIDVHGETLRIDTLQREAWISKTFSDLNNSDLTFPEVQLKDRSFENFIRLEYKVKGMGIIKFRDGSFLKIISSSSHDNPEVGDITCAMNHLGQTFIHRSHNCGGTLHFILNIKLRVNSVFDFIHYFYSAIDQSKWISYY